MTQEIFASIAVGDTVFVESVTFSCGVSKRVVSRKTAKTIYFEDAVYPRQIAVNQHGAKVFLTFLDYLHWRRNRLVNDLLGAEKQVERLKISLLEIDERIKAEVQE